VANRATTIVAVAGDDAATSKELVAAIHAAVQPTLAEENWTDIAALLAGDAAHAALRPRVASAPAAAAGCGPNVIAA
jgi:hypothetical protein